MSIGLLMTGECRDISRLEETARALAGEAGYGISVWEDGMNIYLCPMGVLEVGWKADAERAGDWQVEAQCQSTPAGPGLHKAALEFAERLGLEGTTMDDETAYYSHRDFARMKKEHFYPWLKMLENICRRELTGDDKGQMCLGWALDLYIPQEKKRTIVTEMGRFTPEAFAALTEAGMEAAVRRFFLWPNEERDGLFYRNRAIWALWTRCYFAVSARSAEDQRINGGLLDDLEQAYRMEPSLPLPYEAYEEVCALDGRSPSLPGQCVRLAWEFPVGYRKELVTERVGRLNLTIPGAYRYEWEEKESGGGTHLWWDLVTDSPQWRVTAFRARSGKAAFSEHMHEVNDLLQRKLSGGEMWAGWKRGDGCYFMECEVISGADLYLLIIAYEKQKQRKEIERLLKYISLVPDNSKREQVGDES